MSFKNFNKTAELLSYGFMGMRFRKLADKKKKLVKKDHEFLFRIIEFFESAKRGQQIIRTGKSTNTPVEDLGNYRLCLELTEKLYKFKEIKSFDNKINEYIITLHAILDCGEIIPKALKELRDFFWKMQKYSIEENAKNMHRCVL